MREENFLRRIESLLKTYDHSRPFSQYLKEHFKSHPEMGARDRRMTREWCYSYYRIGKALKEHNFRQRLSVAIYLCLTQENSYTARVFNETPFSSSDLGKNPDEKIKHVQLIYPDFNMDDIFPMHEHLSDEIPIHQWALSFLSKPKVWIRYKPERKEALVSELNRLEIVYDHVPDTNAFVFAPGTQLEKTDSYQQGFFEIQDISSQLTGNYFTPRKGEKWWDTCAGSGGKSLLLVEVESDLQIFATDVRPNILANYADRMRKSDFHNFETQVFDFDPQSKKNLNFPVVDGIIADVPCTGSGTWARTPEWNQKDVGERLKNHFVPLQRTIFSRTLTQLKQGKPFIYITCSVFKEENEENIHYFESTLPVVLEKFEYFKGFSIGADTLFVARFIKK